MHILVCQVAENVDASILAAAQQHAKERGGNAIAAQDEAELYKQMLIDFQMEQAKLSRDIQAMLAEKDAELKRLRGATAVLEGETASAAGESPAALQREESEVLAIDNTAGESGGGGDSTGANGESLEALKKDAEHWHARFRGAVEKATEDGMRQRVKDQRIAALEQQMAALEQQVAERDAAVVKLGLERDACLAREVEREAVMNSIVEEYTQLTSEAEQERARSADTIDGLKSARDELLEKLRLHDQSILKLIEEGRGARTVTDGPDKASLSGAKKLVSIGGGIAGKLKKGKGAQGGEGEEELSFSPSPTDELKDEVTFVRHKSFALQVELGEKTRQLQAVTLELQAAKDELQRLQGEGGATQPQPSADADAQQSTRGVEADVEVDASAASSQVQQQLEQSAATLAALNTQVAQLQAELAAAEAAAAAGSAAALAALRAELTQDAAADKAAALAQLAQEKDAEAASAAAALRASLESAAAAAAASATAAAAAAAEVDKKAALAALEETCRADKENALKELGARKDAEAEAALADLRASHEAAMASVKQDLEQQLKALDDRHGEDKQHAITALRDELRLEVQAARDLYTKELRARIAAHNKLMDLQGNIRVLARVRPVLEVERNSGQGTDVTEFPTEVELLVKRDEATRSAFEFDRVFPPSSTQEQVFEGVHPLIVSVLDGFDVAIFAYGQTGSGKTFTMEGDATNPGVNTRAMQTLFELGRQRSNDIKYTFTLSVLEIYNESIYDLLSDSATTSSAAAAATGAGVSGSSPPTTSGRKGERGRGLDIRQGAAGIIVPGLAAVEVDSMEMVTAQLEQANKARAVGSHDMNEHSSRSHMIVCIHVNGVNAHNGAATRAKLNLIDLAGSERVGKTDASGDRLKEAQNINRSLSALGDVIAALATRSKGSHIPFRNSKLTYLLQDCLSGGGKTLMFCNVSPAAYNLGETICSLNFAARCRAVELGPAKKNAESAEVSRCKRAVDALTAQLQSLGVTPAATLSAPSSAAASPTNTSPSKLPLSAAAAAAGSSSGVGGSRGSSPQPGAERAAAAAAAGGSRRSSTGAVPKKAP